MNESKIFFATKATGILAALMVVGAFALSQTVITDIAYGEAVPLIPSTQVILT